MVRVREGIQAYMNLGCAHVYGCESIVTVKENTCKCVSLDACECRNRMPQKTE
jgi:hypothetical protein